eukprot:jgi/Ulvmu1/8907/UM049_0089.1
MAETPDWDKLSFGLEHTAPYMYVAKWTVDGGWKSEGVKPYGNLSMPPSATVLNYGQALFEGMKALTSAKGRHVLFRPLMNAQRMRAGAQRMSMEEIPERVFLQGIKELVTANTSHIPPLGKGSMYLRPLLLGTGPTLGLAPSPEITFVVFSAAVGSYFAGGQLTPINLKVETKYHRAAPLGVGAAKCAGNYGAGIQALMKAKKEGFTDVVYLDARSDTNLEELSAANIFSVKGKHIKTPPLNGTILPGVTRASIIELAASLGFTISEEAIPITEALDADEIFTCGTAVVVCPVGSLTYKGEKTVFGEEGKPGEVCQTLFDAVSALQTEQRDAPDGWVVPLDEFDAVINAAPAE